MQALTFKKIVNKKKESLRCTIKEIIFKIN